jgi:hypothetical protein
MLVEMRKHERLKIGGVVHFSDVFKDDEPQIDREKYEGEIVDISPDGICIRADHDCARGSKVLITIKNYYKGTFTGIVRRCLKYSDSKYHIGLEVPFTTDSNMDKYADI